MLAPARCRRNEFYDHAENRWRKALSNPRHPFFTDSPARGGHWSPMEWVSQIAIRASTGAPTGVTDPGYSNSSNSSNSNPRHSLFHRQPSPR